MKREILISQLSNEKQVAILGDHVLQEYYIERSSSHRMFGNIYKARVKTVVPGMGAAFITLGTPKDGFLYVTDALKSPFDRDVEFEEAGEKSQEKPKEKSKERRPPRRNDRKRDRHKKIEDVLKAGQEINVQIVKEPIRNKGPRLTTHISIPARYLVMIPGESKVGVSRRIEDRKERERIRAIFREMELPKGVGFIVRTAGEGKNAKEFNRDIKYLMRLWKKISASIKTKKAPSLIYEELDLVERTIRDHLVDESDCIFVDNKDIQRKVARFLNLYVPGHKITVPVHHDKETLFEKHKIEKEIERTFQKKVNLKSGGHIVIEQTEGLVAIDVNTGKFTGNVNLEETVFKTNMEAAVEIARQARLRDFGGIIIIDFIDMERFENRRTLSRAFREAMRGDRAKTNILPMSELGLIELTRQRIRPSLESAVYDTCSYCDGKGIVKSPLSMAIQTLKELTKVLGRKGGRNINAYVHPEVSECLLSKEKHALQRLERASKSRISVFADAKLHVEDVNLTFVK